MQTLQNTQCFASQDLGTAVCLCRRKLVTTKLGGIIHEYHQNMCSRHCRLSVPKKMSFDKTWGKYERDLSYPPNIKSPPSAWHTVIQESPQASNKSPHGMQIILAHRPPPKLNITFRRSGIIVCQCVLLIPSHPKASKKMKSELLSHLAHRFLGFRADVHFHAIPTGRLAACFKKHLKACKSYWHTGPHQKQPGFFKPY